ncbi:MAG: hypothetical protein K8R58_10110 [Bacteroidales bacterium]|nr:hypothetical protein [Bacteroidales bacterium]
MTNIITKILAYIFIFSILTSCRNSKPDTTENYKLISYLDIKVDKKGNLPKVPYVIDLHKNKKHLIVIGTLHSRDTANNMFAEIEKIFADFQPEIAINEGGQITKTFSDKNSAIIKNGEFGLLKFLCDNQNIKMLNGDMPDNKEFDELSKYYSKDETLFFFASERFVLPYTYWDEKGNLDSLYESDFIENYLLSEGIQLTSEEKQFSYYKGLYKKFFKKEFCIDSINSDDFSPIRNNHHFCGVARKSKELRDKYLIQQIEEQLKYYNKVLIVFGGWHILAIEPALTQIINNTEE